MYDLMHQFIHYEGISSIPSSISHFVILPLSFVSSLNDHIYPIYTLHKVTVVLIDSISVQVTYQYTVQNLCHTLYSYQVIHPIPFTNLTCTWEHLSLYIEDIFCYCLDNYHIYTSLLLYACDT